MKILKSYFPELTEDQIGKFEQLLPLYEEWNAKINVISRKDLPNFYERHVLHSLGIAKVISFQAGSRILDVGTGGGFPGIPLAILFPEVEFLLVDSIAKKIKVVQQVTDQLGLNNVQAKQIRAEQIRPKHQFDFITCRAVTNISVFFKWVKPLVKKENQHTQFANGIWALKGGDLREEFQALKKHHRFFELSDYFNESFFETKKVIYIRI